VEFGVKSQIPAFLHPAQAMTACNHPIFLIYLCMRAVIRVKCCIQKNCTDAARSEKMNTIRELFVSYSHVNGESPTFRLVADRETLETIKNGAPLFKRVGSIVNVDSINEADPIITIVCVTSKELQPGEPESITQAVVFWLQQQGEMWT
jgi:hypothetical protein